MSKTRERHGVDRATARDQGKTRKVAETALRNSGSVSRATEVLREKAAENLEAAVVAIRDGAGYERTRQLMDRADRQLRAVELLAVSESDLR